MYAVDATLDSIALSRPLPSVRAGRLVFTVYPAWFEAGYGVEHGWAVHVVKEGGGGGEQWWFVYYTDAPDAISAIDRVRFRLRNTL